jgi:2-oxoglutarate dehydrogenase E1 component
MEEDVFSYANLANAVFLEDLYKKYKENPESVDLSWRYFFSGLEFAPKEGSSLVSESGASLGVFRLIQAYRTYGHKKASFSPLIEEKERIKELELSNFGLQEQDLNSNFATFGVLPEKEASLSAIIKHLEKVYCETVGYEFIGLGSEIEAWIVSEVEGPRKGLSPQEKQKILHDLTSTEFFETFMHTKYPGQTRFSLEGGETFIPLLNSLIDKGGDDQVKEVIIGMAHRGRLNVLAHVLNKPYQAIFDEFEDTVEEEGSGDVKYHRGFNGTLKSSSGISIEASLSPNPSHLESVDPVVEGQVRARQDIMKEGDPKKAILPILVHGDASLSGQGVVYEILQMGALRGYTTGGTIHIVFNNHIGYTTESKDSRSTLYCTDIAKTFGAPVFHAHAEDPEMCIEVARLAMKFRQTFHKDVFIDLGCYRKHGHNEGDEPSFTQPQAYRKIKEKMSIRELFKAELLKEGSLSEDQLKKEEELIQSHLKEAMDAALAQKKKVEKIEKPLVQSGLKVDVPLLSESTLRSLSESFCAVPNGFSIHSKLQRILNARLKLDKIDWGMAEQMAFASLVTENILVRLSGQDVERGTFSHRHCTWVNQETSEKYSPLSHLSKDQAPFMAYNSLLSEFAVMGFDFGYSLSAERSLVIWEAQYGDFVNGSQVIIDQYLATSEQKWSRTSNLTLLLPHGYEGKGPEHSSARVERFLQLCAEDNLTVANCTTPAQYYHLLRRQAYIKDKRPLIIFAPKVLLRNPACTSLLSDFTQGAFQEVLDDPTPPQKTERVIFCTGKVFYDLLEERQKNEEDSTLIIRLEQLYPFPEKEIVRVLKNNLDVKKVLWVQEEHKNMGAWTYIQLKLQDLLKIPPKYVGRAERASPATGSYTIHKNQYEKLMKEAFQDEKDS